MDESEPITNQAPALVGTIVADRYRIEELLGEGAMGAVYRAQHIHMQKLVALKVLHRETGANQEVVRRFEREAVAAGRVVHPHVATAQDFGQLGDGSFYLVLEYVAGKSLRDVLEEFGSLPTDRACRIGEQVASALAAAHAAGIVHRDLKPENVMLVGDTEGDFIKVLDFGLAKLGKEESTDTKLTKMGAVYGTPQYMAPEQAAGTEVDHRADLYALGVMLYEMVNGAPPFEADTMVALLIKHMTEEPPPLPAHVPRELAQAISRALEKKPEDRFATAEEFWSALQAASPAPYPQERLTRGSLASFGFRPLPPAPVIQERGFLQKASHLALRAKDWALVPMSILGRKIPRGLFVLAGFLLVLLFLALRPQEPQPALVASPTAGEPQGATQEVSPSRPQPNDPDLKKVIEAARAGSDSALYALSQRPDAERSADEWLALTQARLMRRDVQAGLLAFGKAIEKDKSAASDDVILGALRALTKDEEEANPILNFAADRLGAVGADFLFHVWAKTSAKNAVTTLAGELLASAKVKEQMSDALRVAMALRDAKECPEFRALLPDLEKFGDQRSIVKIRDLELDKQKGCGPNKRSDCYPCLRGDSQLKNAMAQAGMRAAPQFELPRRFRFLR